jgi:hypothetical protein
MSNDPLDFPDTSKAFGAVITFPPGMTKEQCNDILKRMYKAGYCNASYRGEAPTCSEYNPNHGSPVWYIP